MNEVLENLIAELPKQLENKYNKGAEEHGNHLTDKPNFAFMKPELLDLLIYYAHHEAQLKKAVDMLEELLNNAKGTGILERQLLKIINSLTYGNTEGKEYKD